MKKSYKIEVDCANCANKMEEAAKATTGVKDAVVCFIIEACSISKYGRLFIIEINKLVDQLLSLRLIILVRNIEIGVREVCPQ